MRNLLIVVCIGIMFACLCGCNCPIYQPSVEMSKNILHKEYLNKYVKKDAKLSTEEKERRELAVEAYDRLLEEYNKNY